MSKSLFHSNMASRRSQRKITDNTKDKPSEQISSALWATHESLIKTILQLRELAKQTAKGRPMRNIKGVNNPQSISDTFISDTFDPQPEANIEIFLRNAFSELSIEKLDFTTEASSKEALAIIEAKSAQIEGLLRHIRALKTMLSSRSMRL